MTVAQAATMMNGRIAGPASGVRFDRVEIDSRRIRRGDLFFAIRGPRFDGHDFLTQAARAGAAAAVVERAASASLPLIRVGSSLEALARLAAAWRAEQAVTVVAVTGSNGKTTVKEMLRAVLERVAPTHATSGNLNNHIGVPLSLLGLRASHRFGVFELAMSAPGEIARSAAQARPAVAVITNAAPAHLEGLGSVENIARAKGEIIDALPADGTLIANGDDPFFDAWRERAGARRVLAFGLAPCDGVTGSLKPAATGTTLEVTAPGLIQGVLALRLQLRGAANARNALAATAAALTLGCDPADVSAGLAAVRPVPGRLAPVPARGGATVIDDTYNANPASVQAAIEAIQTIDTGGSRRLLVLGEMAELGPDSEALHAAVGRFARGRVDGLYTLGERAGVAAAGFGIGATAVSALETLVEALESELRPGTLILVKGSRSARMERVVEALRDTGATEG